MIFIAIYPVTKPKLKFTKFNPESNSGSEIMQLTLNTIATIAAGQT
ncbi:MAG: hypothetical protein FWE21_02745 [Defluviitaleaceae bacterium]|nr:hypothetical protein [Defluviitaleaceae bacterium]